MILILAPTRQIAEQIAKELRVKEDWPRFAYNVTHRWLDPRDIETSLRGGRGQEIVMATSARKPKALGHGWRGLAWDKAIQWLKVNGPIYELKIRLHHLP
jgi:hypothetical protein